jgi:hypothetical protein
MPIGKPVGYSTTGFFVSVILLRRSDRFFGLNGFEIVYCRLGVAQAETERRHVRVDGGQAIL